MQNTADGCINDFSAPYNFVLTAITNVGDASVKLYPNPEKGKLYLNWSGNSILSLHATVTDVYGKQMRVFKILRAGSTMDVSGLPAGIYVVKIYSDWPKINRTVKIIKLK